jgi:hypothetical protein
VETLAVVGEIMEMSKESAEEFFAYVFKGKHHVPGNLKPNGNGWQINCSRMLSTYDSNTLTRLVLLAHKQSVRVLIEPLNFQFVRILIHQREQNGTRCFSKHPTIEEAIEDFG